MGRPAGSAALVLVGAATPLHPERALFDAMLVGWGRQHAARRNDPAHIVSFRLFPCREYGKGFLQMASITDASNRQTGGKDKWQLFLIFSPFLSWSASWSCLSGALRT